MKTVHTKLMEKAQTLLRPLGGRNLQACGLRFVAIDNNPRHGWIAMGHEGVVEVVQRLGQWWVMPPRALPQGG